MARVVANKVYHLEVDRTSGLHRVVEENAPISVGEILPGCLDEIPICDECMEQANPYVVIDGGETLCMECASRGVWTCPNCKKAWEADLSGCDDDIIFDDPTTSFWSMPSGTLDNLTHCPACTNSAATGKLPPWKFHIVERVIEMKAYDYEAVAYDGEVYCTECLPDGVSVDGDEAYPVFADSEWEEYPVCAACGKVHDYVRLTSASQPS